MKKFITVAALLAAGTAFANAAIETELLWGLDFTGDGVSLSSGSTGASNITISANGTVSADGGLFGTGTYTTGTSKLQLSSLTGDALSDTDGAFTISFHAKYNSGGTNWPILASFGIGSSGQYKLTYYVSTSSLIVDRDGPTAAWTDFSNSDGTSGKTLATGFSPSTDWAHYALAFDAASDTLSVYINGSLCGSGTVDVANAVTAIAFGGKTNNTSNTSNLTLSDVAVYSGALASDQIEYLSTHKANDSAIPEPSAFGLLAGAGALALVASRRRRNKR